MPAAAEPVVAVLVAGAVITGAEALLVGVAVTPGRLAGVAALLFLVPEPELQAVNNTVANRQDPKNLYMLDDFGVYTVK